MALVIIPGVGKVDNVTGKVVEPATPAVKKVVSPTGIKPTTVSTSQVAKPITPTQTIPGVGQVGGNGQIAVQAPNTSIPVPKPQPVVKQQTTVQQPNATTTIVGPPQASGNYANNAYGYIDKLYDAKAQNTYNSYKNAYDNTMTTINRAAAEINPTYQTEKQKATSQSELQKLNFAQYLQSRGVGSGGQMQAELSRQSSLGNTLGTLQTNKLKALENVQNKRTDAATSFNQKWADYLGESNLSKAKAVQAQKQAEETARAKAKSEAAKQARADNRAAANRANATANAQIRANATISAAQIKAKNTADKAAAEARKPANVEKAIKTQFNIKVDKDTGETTVVRGGKDLPGISKVITTSGMTPAEQYNMLKKYGIVTDNGSKPLGKINLSRFVENVVNSGIDKRQAYSYLKKVGVNFNTPNYKTGKKQTPEQIIDNILKGLMPSGAKYAK